LIFPAGIGRHDAVCGSEPFRLLHAAPVDVDRAVADGEARDRGSDFSDRADALVPEDATVFDCWNVPFEDVQVSAANGRGFIPSIGQGALT
jgi:hypothetical protein